MRLEYETDEEYAAFVEEQKAISILLGRKFDPSELRRQHKEPEVAKILIMGDTHGSVHSYLRTLDYAARNNIKHIFQMGDCGTFPEYSPTSTQELFEQVNEYSRRHNIINYWVRGNHDDTDMWQGIIDHFPTAHKGMGYLRSHIRLMPRVGYFKMFGLNFLEVGGAVSIDTEWRRKNEQTPRTLWWPDEIISPEDLNKVNYQKVDILMTHDCSDRTPWKMRLKEDFDSKMNRVKIDDILKRSKPDFHFHGHMHTQYDWMNRTNGDHWVRTIGLECNAEAMENDREFNNFVIFDTETKEITWKNQL